MPCCRHEQALGRTARGARISQSTCAPELPLRFRGSSYLLMWKSRQFGASCVSEIRCWDTANNMKNMYVLRPALQCDRNGKCSGKISLNPRILSFQIKVSTTFPVSIALQRWSQNMHIFHVICRIPTQCFRDAVCIELP